MLTFSTLLLATAALLSHSCCRLALLIRAVIASAEM
jgi:hypothetical protein